MDTVIQTAKLPEGELTSCHYATPVRHGPRLTDAEFASESRAAVDRYTTALAREFEAMVGNSGWTLERDLCDYVYRNSCTAFLAAVGVTNLTPRTSAVYECAVYLRTVVHRLETLRLGAEGTTETPDSLRVRVGGDLSEARDLLVTLYTNRVFAL